jgi:hypothetical protein
MLYYGALKNVIMGEKEEDVEVTSYLRMEQANTLNLREDDDKYTCE